MPGNIEIKARPRDAGRLRTRVEALAGPPAQIIFQEDTFFPTPSGRLKLRVFAPDRGELIYYQRPDGDGPKPSDYTISVTSEPQSLKDVLTAAFGVRGVVRKRRDLYLVGQTRVHLDQVEDLGDFIELEYVMRPGQAEGEAAAVVRELMSQLEIESTDLISRAYIDLLNQAAFKNDD